MGIKRYTFSDYKNIAYHYLKQHGFSSKNSLPINIEVLIDKAGITIHPIPSMYRDFGVKGAVLKKIGGYDIAIDEDQYEQEFYFRFTLAEELSHILLHENYVSDITTLDEAVAFHQSFNDDEYRQIEQQARALASQLLLPSHLFDHYVLQWVGDNIDLLRKSSFFSKMDLVEYLAENTYKNLMLSKDVVRYSIKRYPDPIIDKIISKFGESLIQ